VNIPFQNRGIYVGQIHEFDLQSTTVIKPTNHEFDLQPTVIKHLFMNLTKSLFLYLYKKSINEISSSNILDFNNGFGL